MEHDPIRWLYGLEQFGIKLGLDPMRRLLALAGRPDTAFRSILVGGTNGKGSVAAFLDSMLRAAAVPTGLYTSPHLVRPHERIRIAGSDVGDDDLRRHVGTVRRLIDDAVASGTLEGHPSFFEAITLAALLAFREAGVRIAVLEVGLGGRLDATNAVEAVTSVVVSVDLDHTDRLGSTIEAIASEKAGIVKAGRPLVSGVAAPAAAAVLREACARGGGTFLDARALATIVPAGGGRFSIETATARYRDLRSGLSGEHQLENARVAVVALEALAREATIDLPPDAVRDGLASVRWRGRLEWIEGSPPVLVDGAHNPAGAETLARFVRDRSGPKPILVFAAVSGKDVAGILAPLAPLVASAIVARPSVARAADPEEVAGIARRCGLACEVVPDPAAAFERARRAAAPDRYVLVAGSLYLVGEILATLEGSSPSPISL